ncbi:MAG TPA: toll/interleukin-1 receptor domain-containing protein [Micropepsaceae bacterium]|jgi:hypothetical protein|nr:toll/interleukin-1 receptor domain-containing protein [Micropepsaceae bacterium]
MAKKLWLTYAWRDNEEKDIDFIVHELDKTALELRFDRRNLVPGQRLWTQIGAAITDPNQCDSWGIVLTPGSVSSEPCIEELSYAIDRALSASDGGFPVFALLHKITPSEMPPSLRVRLGVPLSDSSWVEQVVAAVERRSVGFKPEALSPWVLKYHKTAEGECLEIRPRFDRISPFAVCVDLAEKESGNVTECHVGPAGAVPNGHIAFSWIDSQTTLTDGTRAWAWGAQNEANSTTSYFLFYKRRPRRVWFGHQQKLIMVEL